jgi:hypothetical protein
LTKTFILNNIVLNLKRRCLYGEVRDHKEDSKKGCSEEGKKDKKVKERGLKEGFKAPLFVYG